MCEIQKPTANSTCNLIIINLSIHNDCLERMQHGVSYNMNLLLLGGVLKSTTKTSTTYHMENNDNYFHRAAIQHDHNLRLLQRYAAPIYLLTCYFKHPLETIWI